MQATVKRFADFVLGKERHEATERLRQLVLGIAGIGGVLLLLAVSAVVYLVPFGKSTYTAELTEAGTVKTGDEVRVAGITVGKVTSLELHDDSVEMTFTMNDDVFVGDETTLDIRMLTPIGGHYVAVFSAGKQPLGDKTIPPDHVTLPYSLARALQDSQRPLAAVDADTLRRNIDALSGAIDRSPDSVRQLTDAMSSFVDLVDKQNEDLNRALDVADEYVTLLRNYKSVIGDMLTKIGVMETAVLSREGEVREALRIVTELLARIAAIEPTYRTQLEPMIDKFFESVPKLRELGGRLGTVGRSLHDLGARLQGLAGPQGAPAIDQSAQGFCLPLPGRGC